MSQPVKKGRSAASEKWPRGSNFENVHADVLKFFPELVRELGGDPARLLQRFGKKLSDLSHTGGGVSYRLFVELLEHAAAAFNCADFGLRLAARQGTGVHGLIGTAMKSANTLGEALEYVSSHAHVHSLAARITLERSSRDQSMFVGHDVLLGQLPNQQQVMEQIMLLGHLGAVEITDGLARVRRVHFRHHPLSPPGTYRRYFGCEVRFNQSRDGILFSKSDLQCPAVGASRKAFEAASSRIDTRFPAAAPPMNAQVRGIIRQFLGTTECHNARVAAELGLHPRTMHRRLRAEGKSFQKVKDEVRRDAALYYLRKTKLDLTHVAERLGYAEHSVFTRSCVRWFAKAPSRMR